MVDDAVVTRLELTAVLFVVTVMFGVTVLFVVVFVDTELLTDMGTVVRLNSFVAISELNKDGASLALSYEPNGGATRSTNGGDGLDVDVFPCCEANALLC